MPKLFISYRREDSAVVAGRIFDRLKAHFGRSSVFMDVDIPYGADFRKHLSDMVVQCDVMLVLIGVDWLKEQADGRRRIDEPNDFVRIEVKAALDLGIRVVPILLGPAMMPLEDHLPDGLKELAYRQAAQVDPGKDFHLYMDRVVKKLEQLLAQLRTPAPQAVPASSNGPAAIASPAPPPEPALEELVKSVRMVYGYNTSDNRGQVFAKLKITLGKVEAVFGYLESLLDRADEDLVEKATVLLAKHCQTPSGRVARQALLALQTSTSTGTRYALSREMAALFQANRALWDLELQDEVVEALKFVAAYDGVHMVRLAAIEAIVPLGREDVTDFLVSIARSKKGIGENPSDWSHAISTLAKSGDAGAAWALAQLCLEPQADLDVLQSIAYWVKCHLYRFERASHDVKVGLGEGAKAVVANEFETVHPPYGDAALILLMCFIPEEAVAVLAAFLETGDTTREKALCRSLAAVEGKEQKMRFLRRLKENPGAAKAVLEALKSTAADPDSNEHLKKSVATAMSLLQTE